MDRLGARVLNRTTLARQWLLARHDATALAGLEHLVGMQAQAPHAPYVGLWSRLRSFRAEDLSQALLDRAAVRGSMMRATLHLVSDRDFLALRPLVQPCLDRDLFPNQTFGGRRLAGLDIAAVARAGRALIEQEPRTPAELREPLAALWPERDPAALAYAVRCLVPTVQVPPRGLWGRGGPARITAGDHWIGRPLDPAPRIGDLVLRYLRAFGPASVADMQTWSGLTGLADVVDGLAGAVRAYAGPGDRILYDAADAELADPETPAPVRFLPEYDNLLLAYADRTRVIADDVRAWMARPNGIVVGTVLCDGAVRAAWRLLRARGSATVEIEPMRRLPKRTLAAIEAEGRRLVRFAAPAGALGDVRVLPAALR